MLLKDRICHDRTSVTIMIVNCCTIVRILGRLNRMTVSFLLLWNAALVMAAGVPTRGGIDHNRNSQEAAMNMQSNGELGETTKQEQECTVQLDGSCVVSSKIKGDDTVASNLVIPPLPVPNKYGYVETLYGEKQKISGIGNRKVTEVTKERFQRMHEYMYTTVYGAPENNDYNDDDSIDWKNECRNNDELCTYWAATGECVNSASYMIIDCAPACFTCDKLIFENRCPIPLNVSEYDIWKHTNALNAMFEDIVSNDSYYSKQYGAITVLLRPGMKPNLHSTDDSTTTTAITNTTAIEDSPWIVMIDNFLTPKECNTLIRLGAKNGYEISTDVGIRQVDGTYSAVQSKGRTSSNTWCQNDECYFHPDTQNVLHKIANLTAIPIVNSEYLQLLKYNVGQFYNQHHDYVDHDIDRMQGVRIVTVFLYLNDVKKGGGTNFPLLNVTIMPQQGRALIWPSVLNEFPIQKDHRTDHQALPVEDGIKYGANAWLHMRNFHEPYQTNCA